MAVTLAELFDLAHQGVDATPPTAVADHAAALCQVSRGIRSLIDTTRKDKPPLGYTPRRDAVAMVELQAHDLWPEVSGTLAQLVAACDVPSGAHPGHHSLASDRVAVLADAVSLSVPNLGRRERQVLVGELAELAGASCDSLLTVAQHGLADQLHEIRDAASGIANHIDRNPWPPDALAGLDTLIPSGNLESQDVVDMGTRLLRTVERQDNFNVAEVRLVAMLGQHTSKLAGQIAGKEPIGMGTPGWANQSWVVARAYLTMLDDGTKRFPPLSSETIRDGLQLGRRLRGFDVKAPGTATEIQALSAVMADVTSHVSFRVSPWEENGLVFGRARALPSFEDAPLSTVPSEGARLAPGDTWPLGRSLQLGHAQLLAQSGALVNLVEKDGGQPRQLYRVARGVENRHYTTGAEIDLPFVDVVHAAKNGEWYADQTPMTRKPGMGIAV